MAGGTAGPGARSLLEVVAQVLPQDSPCVLYHPGWSNLAGVGSITGDPQAPAAVMLRVLEFLQQGLLPRMSIWTQGC